MTLHTTLKNNKRRLEEEQNRKVQRPNDIAAFRHIVIEIGALIARKTRKRENGQELALR